MHTYAYMYTCTLVTVCTLPSLHVDQCFVSRLNTQTSFQAKPEGPKDLRLCRVQAMVDTVCPSGHADVWFVTPHTSTFFVWFM